MKELIYLFLVFSIFSCRTDDEQDQSVLVTDAKVLILNEGNYNFGNSSLSLYHQNENRVDNKVFQSNNSGRPIGDVVQSAVQIGNELFVVVNNSSKIEILVASNLTSITAIQQLNSPRYIAVANAQNVNCKRQTLFYSCG